jgi:hypothetical protein
MQFFPMVSFRIVVGILPGAEVGNHVGVVYATCHTLTQRVIMGYTSSLWQMATQALISTCGIVVSVGTKAYFPGSLCGAQLIHVVTASFVM